MINCGRDEKLSFCKDSSQSKFDIRSLVLTWEVAEDNPEHIDFWRISINKVKTHVYVLHKAMNIFSTSFHSFWGCFRLSIEENWDKLNQEKGGDGKRQ